MSDLRPLPEQLYQDYVDIKGIHGEFLLGSMGMLVIRGLEDMRFLVKSCPIPYLSPTDPASNVCGGGVEMATAGTNKTLYEGAVTFIETQGGAVNKFAEYVANTGGMITADFYIGRADNYTAVHEMIDIAIRFESPDFDTDNRSEGVTVTGNISYHYFGNSASIGENFTAQAGKVKAKGVDGLVSRINHAMSSVRKGANAVSTISNGVGELGSMFH